MKGFDIVAPRSIEEVLTYLRDDADEAAIYAGGTELLIAIKHGLMSPGRLIDIKHVAEFSEEIVIDDAYLNISATATHFRVSRSETVARHLPILSKVVGQLANPRVRSVGTAVGNLCFAEPHSDVATTTVLLGADVAIQSDADRQWMPVEEFVSDAYETVLTPGCFVSALRIPLPAASAHYGYRRMKGAERPLATAGVCLDIRNDEVTSAEISIGAVGPKSQRFRELEARLVGHDVSRVRSILGEVASGIAKGVEVEADYEASENFRRHLAGELFLRAAGDAIRSYRGGT